MKDKKIYIRMGIFFFICFYAVGIIAMYFEIRYNLTKYIEVLSFASVGSLFLFISEAFFLKAKVVPKLLKIFIYWQWIQVPIVLISMWIYTLCNPGITFQ